MADLPNVHQNAGGPGTDIAETWSRADQVAAERSEPPADTETPEESPEEPSDET